jgi:hypothetical protein
MGKFADFQFYWEEYGSYPDRDFPFGLPTLIWLIAKDNAVRCRVSAESKSAMEVQWSADWKQIPSEIVQRLTDILEEVGAFGELKPLVENSQDGDYLVVWDLTGVFGQRTFHFSVEWTCPGERWTLIGERFREVMVALRSATLLPPDEEIDDKT